MRVKSIAEHVTKAIADTKNAALTIGAYWAIAMTFGIASRITRHATEPYFWAKVIAVVILGYMTIMCGVFLYYFCFGKRSSSWDI